MSVKYKLVLKKDLTKGAAIDAKRYYASANVTGMMDFDTICDVVADRSPLYIARICGTVTWLSSCWD